jgi:hypothetical protein
LTKAYDTIELEGQMRVLIGRDDVQLRRLERSISDFNARPTAERQRMGLLLAALERERLALVKPQRVKAREMTIYEHA